MEGQVARILDKLQEAMAKLPQVELSLLNINDAAVKEEFDFPEDSHWMWGALQRSLPAVALGAMLAAAIKFRQKCISITFALWSKGSQFLEPAVSGSSEQAEPIPDHNDQGGEGAAGLSMTDNYLG